MNIEVKNFKIAKLDSTKFVHPFKVSYTLNGRDKSWEVVKSHNSVAVLLYHTQEKGFIFVNQFRAPVYLNNNDIKFTYELCAGLVDKDLSLVQIAKEEIDEECGYKVEEKDIVKITSFYSNVGVSGGRQTLFFAKIDESMKIHNGGGIDDEQIELFFLPLDKVDEFIFDESKAKTPGLMFSLYWFLKNKKDLDV